MGKVYRRWRSTKSASVQATIEEMHQAENVESPFKTTIN
jgi:hypothetical protein